MKKRALSLVLAVLMLLVLAACGGGKASAAPQKHSISQSRDETTDPMKARNDNPEKIDQDETAKAIKARNENPEKHKAIAASEP